MRAHKHFRTCALQVIQNTHLWFKILNSGEINMQSRLFCLQMVILPHWFCSAVWFFSVCIPGSWGSWLRNKIWVTVHSYLLHIWKGNSVTENRLLEADPALLNPTQCQGIEKIPRSAPHFYSWRIRVPASSCRLVCSRSAARPGSPGGSLRAGRAGGQRTAWQGEAHPFPSLSRGWLSRLLKISSFQLKMASEVVPRREEGETWEMGSVPVSASEHTHTHAHAHMHTHAQSWCAARLGKVYFAIRGVSILLKAFAKTGSNFRSLLPIFVSHFLGILPLVFISLRRKLVKE